MLGQMARILICEPHDDITALLELVIRRLGHEPVDWCDHGAAEVDIAVLEPGEPAGLELARLPRRRDIPMLFTSIYPPDAETLELRPAAYLVKPFPLHALERALQRALAAIPARSADGSG
jgi:CheY-like chemotaxis protein